MLLNQESSFVEFLVFQADAFVVIDLFELQFTQTLNRCEGERCRTFVQARKTYGANASSFSLQFAQIETGEGEFFLGLIDILEGRFLEERSQRHCRHGAGVGVPSGHSFVRP